MDLKALLLGGILPMIMLGSSTFLMKLAMKMGASIPLYLATVGATICGTGLLSLLGEGGWRGGTRAVASAVAMGVAWAVAAASMAYSASALKVPVAIIAPLTNANALVAVALSAWLFREWKELDMVRVAIGTVLIVIGVTVVSSAKD
ncbi:MAG: hypothetical protein QHC78_07155 [Pigmentiphaga sp.]|uniref:hypothetical protein n=1 Tax=Pigmentiphaga sp. TaxID=1977564 RepID=UPI0029BD7BCD|nr:hypothetical protein [Pigmentiphaga sp.]MDX3905450.1 hypothetical protein [Pigmentiphaga sp.]